MIEIKNLTKTYKLNKKQMKESRTTNPIKTAVNALTLTAKKGEIYGLLGPNGAGKTTTLRCISTIIKPTKGEIYVDGHEVRKEPEKVREKIGFLTGDIKLDPQFSPDYMFDFFREDPWSEAGEAQRTKRGTVYLFWDQGFCAQKDERAVNRNGAEGCNRSQPGT